jgi:hypothetical protein
MSEKFHHNKPVRWGDICRVLQMFGYMDDSDSKAEAGRIRQLLEKQIEAGRVEQVTDDDGQVVRGFYRLRDQAEHDVA